MSAHGPRCALCGGVIVGKLSEAYQRVTGWEKKRDAGGAHAPRLAARLEEYAHAECVDREASGLSARQEGMF